MPKKAFLIPLALALLCSAPGRAEVVVSDGDIEITREEFEAVLESSADKIKRRAASDVGDRFELITQMVASRKLAARAEQLDREDPGYWDLHFKLQNVKEDFMFKRLVADHEEPDFEALARERYETQKEKYARYPETRASSHILLQSPPGRDRTELREKAEDILQELRAGADFEAYVEEYSDDPGSAEQGGSIERWVRFGDPSITPPYTEALFSIDEVGGYSEVTDSQFGLHIVRLDGIRDSGIVPFDKVKDRIIKDLRTEFRTLAAKEVRARFNLTDDAYIDGDAMDDLFAPYQ